MVSEQLIRKIIQENLTRQLLREEKAGGGEQEETAVTGGKKKAKKKLLWVNKSAADPLHHLKDLKSSGVKQKKGKAVAEEEEDCGCGCNGEECEESAEDIWDFDDQEWEEISDSGKDKKKSKVAEGRRLRLHEESWTSKLGKAITGRSHQITPPSERIIDVSDYELCGDKNVVDIDELINLIKELHDIFDENDLLHVTSKYFVITPYGPDQAAKIYKNAGPDLYVLCLGVAETSYNLWTSFKESNELDLLQMLLKKKIDDRSWSDLWNWLLGILSVGSVKKSGENDWSSYGKLGTNCFSINNFVVNFKNKVLKLQDASEQVENQKDEILAKLKKEKAENSEQQQKKKKLGYDNPLVVGLMRMLKRGVDLENKKLTPEKIQIIKNKIKKELEKDESWGDWMSRKGTKLGNALVSGGVPIFGSGEFPDVDEKDYEDL